MSMDASGPVHRFEQTASTGNFIGLVLKNFLLGLITLTLYRFWGRTEMRRRIWATTSFMGDPFEYTGTGWQLFKGFLIAIPVLFGPAALISLAPMLLPPELYVPVLIGLYLIIFPLIFAAIFLMRRFQLSRTRWRGVRFSMRGSAIGFGLLSTWWALLEVLTLGWYGPAARMRRAKLLWQGARFGDMPFAFGEGENKLARGLYGPFALAWFGVIISFVVAAVIVSVLAVGLLASLGMTLEQFGGQMEPGEMKPEFIFPFVGLILLFYVLWILLAAFFQMPYQAAAANRTAELLTFDGVRFRLKTTTLGWFGTSCAVLAITLVSFGILGPLGSMWQIRYVLNRLELLGEPNLAAVGQNGDNGPSQGEGIADAFDLDIGIGVI